MEKKINEIIKGLNSAEKDYLYRTLWLDYIKIDILTTIVDESENQSPEFVKEAEETAEKLARQYCFDGDYDCNLCYWDNIENLIARDKGWQNA